jgi:ATP-dependent protease ClpP protease subunit
MKIDKLHASLRPNASWYKIRNAKGDEGPAQVIVYDEIGYWGVSAKAFMDELSDISAKEISLRINSPGGGVFDGIAIYNALRAHSAKVTTYVDSLAASIASVIAMAGDRIVMQPHSQMMIHDGSGLCIGDAADMREMGELLDRQSDNIANIYAERAGGTAGKWRDRMRAETWYTDREAVKAHLADEVAELPRRDGDEEETENRWDLTVFSFAGREAAPAPDIDEIQAATEVQDPEPAPDPEPEPEPVPAIAASATPVFDAAAFKAAMALAADDGVQGFDPVAFRATLATLTAEAPAVAPSAKPAVDLGPDPEPAPEVDPEPTPAQTLAEALRTLASEAPAVITAPVEPPPPAPPPTPEPEPEPAPDPWKAAMEMFTAAIAVAARDAPAVADPEPEPDPEPDSYDPVALSRALREAMQ